MGWQTITLNGGLVVENLRAYDEDAEPHNYLGMTRIGGASFHVSFVKVRAADRCESCAEADVEPSECEHGTMQEAVGDPYDRLGDLDGVAEPDDAYDTLNLPGVDGDFVMVIYPFCT